MPSFETIFAESTRTAQPDPSAGDSMREKGAEKVVARFYVSANAGGSTDQVGGMHAEHSSDNVTWIDVPGGAFTNITRGHAMPSEEVLTLRPTLEYLRWVPSHTGTTLSATWGLMVSYRT